MNISHFSIRRPVLTFVSMIIVILLGVVSLFNIPMKLIPDIQPPVGVVVATYPGAGPTEVFEKVTKPLESSLATLPGLKSMTSTSQEGSTLILLQFSWATVIDDMQNDVMQRIDQTPLPDDVQKPRFLKFDPSQFPVIQLTLTSKKGTDELQTLAEQLKAELAKAEGVASVNVSGTLTKRVRVLVDQNKLRTYRLSQQDIANFISANNVSLPGETVVIDERQLSTRILSTVQSVDELKKLVITINPLTNERIRLQDVAKVELVSDEQQTITRTNEQPSVLMSVLQKADANTAEVSKAFQKQLDKLLKKEQFQNVRVNILFDQGEFIERTIRNIAQSLVLGGAFAMAVLFIFLRNIKSPIIIGIAIPYSVIVTFVLMYFSDFTLNIMTLGGLALGIGMLVDNSIVVIENISRHLAMGKEPKEAAKDGVSEVGSAIVASTLTSVAVFIPVLFITGLIGDLFTEFAMTIAFSLLASLFVALTVVPMLASRWLRPRRRYREEARLSSAPMRALERSLRWSLRHRFVVLLVAVSLFGVGVVGLTHVGMQFLPNTDEGFFSIRVQTDDGYSLQATERVVKAIEHELKRVDDIETYVSLIGSTQEQSFRGTTQSNVAEIYVKMKPKDERNRSVFVVVDELKSPVQQAVKKVNKTAEVSFNLQASTGSAPNTLTFSVKDTDEQRLKQVVPQIEKRLKSLKEVKEVTTDLSETVDEIQVNIDQEKALQHGLTPAQVAIVAEQMTRGMTATRMIDASANVYDVTVEYDRNVKNSVNDLKQLLVKKPDGSFVKLGDIASVSIGKSRVQIQRVNEQSAVQFTVKYKNSVTLGDISALVDREIEKLDLPSETDIVFSGDRELLESSIDDLALAFALAVTFVYLVMAAQFESFKHPFIIMFTIPLMIIGIAGGLWLTQTPMSVMVIIGGIVLAGIVVNNAIVLVDYMNQLRVRGERDMIVTAVKLRLRPILMTALTTILGLLPLAFGIGDGAELNQPMAITVIGGLISSTFLTLFVIPIVYSFTLSRKFYIQK
ncbi:efflux RND transporter permease subunit [Anoxybacillus suryakundensis]|uniref:Multidrug efflux pump subunit AcrB n=1 Tax=Anoxybacillus suryakundensis TaxID=1325335 RepID=A0A0K6GPX5_9BACL|nr:efflux RND transporter permease subunit [Anoxybacillus suryakundensis]CUA80810.1 Multidrug efflux pump subunit AcrB [Anoxybacillus suryakundensis]